MAAIRSTIQTFHFRLWPPKYEKIRHLTRRIVDTVVKHGPVVCFQLLTPIVSRRLKFDRNNPGLKSVPYQKNHESILRHAVQSDRGNRPRPMSITTLNDLPVGSATEPLRQGLITRR